MPVAGCGGTVSRVDQLGRTHASDDGVSELSILEACNVFSLVSASSTPCDCSVSLDGLRVCSIHQQRGRQAQLHLGRRRHLTLSIPSQVCSVSLTLSAARNAFSSSCSSCTLDICVQCHPSARAELCIGPSCRRNRTGILSLSELAAPFLPFARGGAIECRSSDCKGSDTAHLTVVVVFSLCALRRGQVVDAVHFTEILW